ncbi:MAG: hypothetical protein P1S60_16645, partial [Anaerolineae bacterium]|nr:hypothetical protein [Anaerolineae bacterium]
MLISAKPYILQNTIQHYAWGTRGADAYIPRLLGFEPQPDTPYAELWLGAHPKAPSQVQAGADLIPLNQFVAQYPDEILGPRVTAQFDGQF